MKNLLRIIAFLAMATLAFGRHKISPDMPAAGPVDVIVQFKTTPTKDQLKLFGPYGQIKKQFVSINAIELTLSVDFVNRIETDPAFGFVQYVSPNRPVSGSLDITAQTVGANLAWASGWDGTGVGIAVIDSGVAAKADLASPNGGNSRILYSQSFVPGLDASDQYGHGTHVAGIVAGNGSASNGANYSRTLKGMAPNANLVNLRVLDANGSGNVSNVISAIDTAIGLQGLYNIRVINLSLGQPIMRAICSIHCARQPRRPGSRG